MNPGRLRHRVTIQTVSYTIDAVGGRAETYTTLATVWGQVTPVDGLEVFLRDQLSPHITHLIDIRHRTGVTATARVQYDSRTFRVESVVNTGERDRFLQLRCVEEIL